MLLLAGCGLDPLQDIPAAGTPPGLPPQTRIAPAPPPPIAAVRPAAPLPASQTRTPVAAKIEEFYPASGRDAVGEPRTPRPNAIGDVTLNFEDADIREVIGVVLRDILGLNYLIDPDVSGTVTLRTARPLTRDAVLPVLEAALNARGATLIETAGLYRVVVQREGVRPGVAPRPGVAGLPLPAGQSLQVFPLQFISATELQKVLELIVPKGRIVIVDESRGLLIVAGNAQEIASVQESVRLFDVDQFAGMNMLLASVDNIDVNVLVNDLNNIFGGQQKGLLAGQVRFIPVNRLNAVIVMAREQRYVEEAFHWITRLDRTRNAADPQLFVYRVQNAKATELVKILQGIFGRNGEETLGRVNAPANEPQGLSPAAGAPSDGPRVEATIAVAGGRGPVRVTADEAGNALLISATSRDYALVQDVLNQLDIVPLQVLIEASIVEVTLNNSLRYGLQYFLQSGGLGIADNGRTILSTGALTTGISPTLPGFAFSLTNGGQTRAVLDALSSLTQINVISSPQLLVLDNQIARLQVGDVVPIITQTATSAVTATPLIVNTVQYRDTGVILEVTPRVNASGIVTLDIIQSVSDVSRTTVTNIDSPTFSQRRILSTVAVETGSTVLLGGLIRERNDKGDSGIPFLHQIPVVGALFGAKNESASRTELIVLLTPRIVRNPEQARDLTQEIRRKFQALVDLEFGGIAQPRPVR